MGMRLKDQLFFFFYKLDLLNTVVWDGTIVQVNQHPSVSVFDELGMSLKNNLSYK